MQDAPHRYNSHQSSRTELLARRRQCTQRALTTLTSLVPVTPTTTTTTTTTTITTTTTTITTITITTTESRNQARAMDAR